MEKANSFEEIVAWYKIGHRDFRSTNLQMVGDQSFEKLDLRGINLSRSSLKNCQFDNVNFSQGDLSAIDLKKSYLYQCNFQQANLFGAKLADALAGECCFTEADLRWADLSKAHVAGATFTRADLSNAKLCGARLALAGAPKRVREEDPVLGCADLTGARLVAADLSDAVIHNVPLERADLRAVKGLRLDSNLVREARFSSGSADLWSVLRRKYTGPMFAFHVFVMICFLVPYALRAEYWLAINEMQSVSAHAAGEVADQLEKRVGNGNSDPQIAAILATVRTFKPCFRYECRSVPIWQLLVGADRGIATAVVPVVLLLYNVCRAFLTWRVTLLREEEERCGFAPSFDSYGPLSRVHGMFSALYYVAVGLLIWHVVKWLTVSVWL